MEEWKTIPDYPNYEASDNGQIRNKQTKYILKQMKNSTGRFCVDLGRQTRMKFVSRLVAKAYHPQQEGKNEVDHINGDKTDNRACNLRWVNRSENLINTRDRGTTTGERCIYKTSTSYLVQIMRNKKYIYRKNFNTLEEAIQNRNLFLNNYNQIQTQNLYTQDQPSTPL